MKTLTACFAAGLIAALVACGSSTTSPTPALNLSGNWTGTGSDAQGDVKFKWALTQNGSAVAGTAIMDSATPDDGSCGSCHKQKTGTVIGTLSGGSLTMTLDFPKGGTDITPLCGLTLVATVSDISAARLAGSYTGTTTCEGPIADGKLTVAK